MRFYSTVGLTRTTFVPGKALDSPSASGQKILWISDVEDLQKANPIGFDSFRRRGAVSVVAVASLAVSGLSSAGAALPGGRLSGADLIDLIPGNWIALS